MRFMMMMVPRDYRPGAPAEEATAELMAEMMAYNDTLAKAGILLSLDGLHPPSSAVRLAFHGKKATITDGPFAEAKEALGGYWLIDVRSKAEAVEWASRCPAQNGDVIEVRQVQDGDYYPDEIMPGISAELASIAPHYKA